MNTLFENNMDIYQPDMFVKGLSQRRITVIDWIEEGDDYDEWMKHYTFTYRVRTDEQPDVLRITVSEPAQRILSKKVYLSLPAHEYSEDLTLLDGVVQVYDNRWKRSMDEIRKRMNNRINLPTDLQDDIMNKLAQYFESENVMS